MKNRIALLLIMVVFTVSNAQNTLQIVSIANDGFLITSDTSKVIIDGIFAKGNTNFAYPNDQVLNQERNADDPFDSIDIILNTHYHADHLHAGYVVEHMTNDTSSVFIGPQQSTDLLTAVTGFDTVQNRVYSITPTVGVAIDTTLKGYNIKILKFTHHNDNANQFQVNGYVFTMNNIRIFHPGDGTMNNMAELQAFHLDEDSIDIAFIPFWIIGDDLESAGRQVISYLNPKIIIIMHVWVSEVEYYKTRIKEIDGLPPVYFLDESMEKLELVKTEDSLIVENRISGIQENTDAKLFNIYPNPTKQFVQFESYTNTSKKTRIELFTPEGQLLENIMIDASHTTIDFSKYTRGVYFLAVNIENQVIVKRLIKL